MALPDPFQDISADFVHADAVTGQALGARKIMLVPGSDVPALALDLPKGLRGQNREQVARRQLRDQFGVGVEAAEMRPFQTRTSGESWSRVLVADRTLVEAWRDRAGAQCRAVLPDYLALPTAPALWSIAATPHGVAVRLGPEDGFGAPIDTALALLDRALQDTDPAPKALLRIGPPQRQFEALFEGRNIPVITDVTQADALGLSKPQVLGHGEGQMDLRQDPQMARAVFAQRVLPWRWPLVLGLIAAGLWAASQLVVIDRIKTETNEITANTTTLVQEHFVKTGPVLDARIQVSQALARMQAEVVGPVTRTDPMQLFNRAAKIIASQGAETRAAIYTGDETLAMVLHVTDFAAAERLAAALSEADLEITVIDTRVNEAASTVRTELQIAARSETDK